MQQKMQYNNFLYYYYYFTQGVADMKMLCWQSWPFPPRGPCFVPFLGQSLAHILFRKKHSSPPPPPRNTRHQVRPWAPPQIDDRITTEVFGERHDRGGQDMSGLGGCAWGSSIGQQDSSIELQCCCGALIPAHMWLRAVEMAQRWAEKLSDNWVVCMGWISGCCHHLWVAHGGNQAQVGGHRGRLLTTRRREPVVGLCVAPPVAYLIGLKSRWTPGDFTPM